MRSHEQAHADGHHDDTVATFKHALVPAGEPTLVEDEKGLHVLVEALREGKSFAYDSEFIGEETYYPRLCVIQVATVESLTLIDPLALGDPHALLPFWELIADPSVEKIVHAGQQDLEPVVRHLNKAPGNIFDVQVAAAFVGAPYPASLTRLIAEMIAPDAAGSVGAKFSQWDQRPLTSVQMRYAANDVRYLPLLRERLGERLEASGNVLFAQREFIELCDPALYKFDATQRLRVRGSERLRPAQQMVLRALLGWRDVEARQLDVPPRTFVKDAVLFEIARSQIQSVEELRLVRGLPRAVKRHSGDRVVSIVREAMNCKQLPKYQEIPDREREREEVERLWHAMRERCHARSIDPAIVTSKREITALVRTRRAGNEVDLRVTRGWRAELLADLL